MCPPANEGMPQRRTITRMLYVHGQRSRGPKDIARYRHVHEFLHTGGVRTFLHDRMRCDSQCQSRIFEEASARLIGAALGRTPW